MSAELQCVCVCVCVCSVMYDENSDDESNKVSSLPTFESVFEVDEEKRATLSEEVTISASSSADDSSAQCLTYMNAADVAEALHDHTTTVSSHHRSDHHEQSDPDRSSQPVPTQEVSMSDVTGRSSDELLVDTSEPESCISRHQDAHNAQSAAQLVSGASRDTSPWRRDGDVNGSTSAVQSRPLVNDNEDVERAPVVMRRPSRQMSALAAGTAAAAAAALPVVQLHIDTDVTPTSLADFQLHQLSTQCGSAVDQLRQFIDDERSSSGTHCSSTASHCIPTAIQPGNAFHSLKYFLSKHY